MNKIAIIIIIVGVILMGVGFFIYKSVSKDKPIDDPKPNKNPKELEIMKDISAGIPFRWEYEIKDQDIVEFVRSYVVKDENTGGKVGAKVHTNYVFKGLKEGNTDITFRVVSITNEYEPYDETIYHIIVDKDLNIRITE